MKLSPDYQDAPAAPLADGNYVITNRLSSKAIAVQSASTDENAGIIQFGYSAAAPNNDQWTLTLQPDGYYRITNVNSGKDLVIKSAGRERSDVAIQHTYSTAAPFNDEWSLVAVGGGYYKIVSRNGDLVLNVDDASLADGANIIQYTFTDVPQSEWLFTLYSILIVTAELRSERGYFIR
jgi:alpha-glucosidase